MAAPSRSHRVVTVERAGRWLAFAVDERTGDRYGVEVAGESEADVAAKLTRWLEWQGNHSAALEELQHAERAYHRVLAGSAFGDAGSAADADAVRVDTLAALERARVRLDDIRARRPEY